MLLGGDAGLFFIIPFAVLTFKSDPRYPTQTVTNPGERWEWVGY